MAVLNNKTFSNHNDLRTQLQNLRREKEPTDKFTKEISTKSTSEESYQDLVRKQKKKQKEHEIDWETVKSKVKKYAYYSIFSILGICIMIVYLISVLQIFGWMSVEYSDFRNLIFNTVLLGVGGFVGWIFNEFLK